MGGRDALLGVRDARVGELAAPEGGGDERSAWGAALKCAFPGSVMRGSVLLLVQVSCVGGEAWVCVGPKETHRSA